MHEVPAEGQDALPPDISYKDASVMYISSYNDRSLSEKATYLLTYPLNSL